MKHEDYKVGWICALPTELAAAACMLDELHNPLPQPATDDNNYTLGRIGPHNVAIAGLPAGVMGVTSAARVAEQMRTSFPSMRFGLMVGIGGGVPSDDHDIRLGDVVVSKPGDTSGGVIQYDFGKTVKECRFVRTSSLNRPPDVLLKAVTNLQARHMYETSRIPRILSDSTARCPLRKQACSYPGASSDQLYCWKYDHVQQQSTCAQCDSSQLVNRLPRPSNDPVMHYGLIASGNQVMRDGVTRERLRKELNILCFEMEAAGLMDTFPCLVVRGICDYADTHKNKQWQDYAAATAAAYAKELLGITHIHGNVGNEGAEKNIYRGIQKLNPNIASDRETLYRYFLSSLSTDPIPRDDQCARQAHYVSEHILSKFHRAGPWGLCLRKYLEDGNPLNIRDFEGKTPLHHAVVTNYDRDDKVRALVEAGADIAMKDFMEQTPVDLARGKNEQIFIFLLKTWQKSVVAEQRYQDKK
ncbi:nucleoside phosphorylase domain-containing protein [Microdochium trichocladiopsis]|uniref:Nucleoside phosphorylase domain-containing protein n=1 Tax=Microdochium trichocladiopsis TaxID=1682393 RepID=A0A9P8XSZ0_9PEZI|nr:nucleoside phosphorylase domain-containing protein [Microdochium trichocladiopsis]KAH7016186.1 nucleoside phosphorylase domain-containing protein [Microdochium trichocladiopsis]